MRQCKAWLSYINDVDVSTSLIGTYQMHGSIATTIHEGGSVQYHNIDGIVADEPYMDAVGYYMRMNTFTDNPIPIITPEEYRNTIQAEITSKYPCWVDGGGHG